MKKKLKHKKAKPVVIRTIYVYVEFANGRVLEVPVTVKNGNYQKRDALIEKLRSRVGYLTDNNQHRYELKNMIHYEIFDEK